MLYVSSILTLIAFCAYSCHANGRIGTSDAYAPSSTRDHQIYRPGQSSDLSGAFGDLTQVSSDLGMKDESLLLDFESGIAASVGALSASAVEGAKRELSAPSFTCQQMNETFNPYFMCSDVVDYPYYLAQGTTLDDLEETVRATVPSAFTLMTGTCLSDYKKMMCSRVFLKCVDGGTNY